MESLSEQAWSRLNTLTHPLLAIHVLSIYTLKHPAAWSTQTDLSLLRVAAEAVEQCYREDGMPAEFYKMLTTLKQFAVHAGQSKLTHHLTEWRPKTQTLGNLKMWL